VLTVLQAFAGLQNQCRRYKTALAPNAILGAITAILGGSVVPSLRNVVIRFHEDTTCRIARAISRLFSVNRNCRYC
jgi:hypothetical protein